MTTAKEPVRFRAWTVQKDREVVMTPEGPVIAERGAVIAVAVAERWEEVCALMRRLDSQEKGDGEGR